ncbi:hypothetical protein [Hyalangium sp.]|uniref:hypothetical protein n=1 Tax=Hyalangium sp. TaxID=2028555 RepID=UPI002D62EE3E|nr:hypothetical protein [Hyalangium sp.]HYH99903.1 hypothetical protein [Hyalangium sp.]
MTSVRAIVFCPLLTVLVATAAIAKEKKPTGSTRSSSSKSSAGKRPQLEERSDPKGFTLKVPGTTTEKRDDWTTTYSARLLPDGALVKATVTVDVLDELTPVTNLDKAVEAVLAARPRGMQATLSEQRELPNGYLVIIGPEYDTYAVTVIRNGKEVQVKAHCTGPSSRLEELKEMCLSVKPTK